MVCLRHLKSLIDFAHLKLSLGRGERKIYVVGLEDVALAMQRKAYRWDDPRHFVTFNTLLAPHRLGLNC